MIFLLFVSSFVLAQKENMRSQIEKSVQENLDSIINGRLSTESYAPDRLPDGIEASRVWTHQNSGEAAREISLDQSGDTSISAYYCARERLYWVNLRVSSLNVDLWYGPYRYSHYGQGSAHFFRQNFAKKASDDRPSLRPSGLVMQASYRCKEHRESLIEYGLSFSSHGKPKMTAYFCAPGMEYWLKVERQHGKTRWYGPYKIFYEKPVSTRKLIQKAVQAMSYRQYDKARGLLQRVIRQEPDNNLAHYNLACIESINYQVDQALYHFENALRYGFRDFHHINRDNDLDNIRNTSRFRELIRKYQGLGGHY